MNNPIVKFTNCRLIRNGQLHSNTDLWIQNGTVIDPELLFYEHQQNADSVIDCQGQILAPGFIDIQINGGFGYDFSDQSVPIEQSLEQVSCQLPAHGVTSFCPTLITSEPQFYHQTIPKVNEYIERNQKCDPKGSKSSPVRTQILGLHLEGPFINGNKKGAHRLDFIQDQQQVTSPQQLIDCYGQLDHVKIITFAPELFDTRVITHLNQLSIVPSIGHCCATLEQCKRAIESGARCITHLFNAMLPFHHREPSVIGSLTLTNRMNLPPPQCSSVHSTTNGHTNGCLTDKNKVMNGTSHPEIPQTTHVSNEAVEPMTELPDKLFYGIISDGAHTHESAVALAYRAYPEGMILVTDAVAPLGLQNDHVHKLGTNTIEIKNNQAFIYGTNTLCGSIAPLNVCIRNFVQNTCGDLVQGINCATINPATLLGLKGKKGDLNFGCDADLVLIDDHLNVLRTYIGGQLAWNGAKSNAH